jgi:integrase
MPNDLDDINNFSGRLQAQIDLAKDLENRADSNALIRWTQSMTDVEKPTKIDRIKNVRLIAERCDRPLVDFEDAADVYRLLDEFRTGEHPDVPDDGLTDGTLRQYRQAARLFFRDELDRGWAEDIHIGNHDPTPVTPDQILTSSEVDRLLDACEHPRDAALISFLAVTGQRITAALSIRLGDVNLDDRSGAIRLNDDAEGLKGAAGPRPLLWSRPYIANWIQNHPRKSDDDAALFCSKQGGKRPHEDGGMVEWEKGDPISRSQAHNDLVKVAKRANVDPDKVKPHNFRHTAITRMRDHAVPDNRIRFIIGVTDDSDRREDDGATPGGLRYRTRRR